MTARWLHWRSVTATLMLLVLVPSFSTAIPTAAKAPTASRGVVRSQSAQTIEGSYIVTLRDDVIGAASVTDYAKHSKNIKVKHEYNHALHGFSAEMSASQAEALAADPRVASVEPDRKIYELGYGLDYGVDRVNADLNTRAKINGIDERVGVDIAIIDSGVGPSSQLNIVGGKNCTNAASYNDEPYAGFYHGTFVAGLAAGIDNAVGLPGVAPGARIWAVKVTRFGSGEWSDVLCGIDWVIDHASTIEVANMSLGANIGGSDPGCISVMHKAICDMVSAGVTVVVAAGNDAANAATYVPAQYPEVITVSAMADSDGSPGGFGPAIYDDFGDLLGKDDGMATFSNYGSVVDIAAPGVENISLQPYGGYAQASGTSFSSPIVAGAAALYIAQYGDVGPSSVRSGLLSKKENYALKGDRDSVAEGVVNASGRSFPTAALSRTAAQVDQPLTITLDNFEPNAAVKIRFDSTQVGQGTVNASGDGSVTFKVPAGVKGNHTISATSHNFLVKKTLTISPRIRLSKTNGVPGSSFNVSLRGFMKQQSVAIKWYNGSSYVTLGTMTTSNTGSANKDFYVPNTYRGGHKVEADPPVGGSVSSSLAVKPLVKIVPGSGATSSTASIELKGFVPSETVKVYFFNGTTKSLLRTKTVSSSTGYASSTVTIPAGATITTHSIRAEGTSASLATTTFIVTSVGGSATTPTPTPTPAPTTTATPEPVATSTPTATAVVETPTDVPTEEPTATPTETPAPTEAPALDESGTPAP